jgi:uncharacterized protein YjdB
MFPVKINAKTASIKISSKSISLKVGEIERLEVTGTRKSIDWDSHNNTVATVDAEGKVTGIGEGTTVITAKVDGVTLRCNVTIYYDLVSMTKNAYKWTAGIWNDCFCNITWYINCGTDSKGNQVDIEEIIAKADEAMKNIQVYDEFFNNLDSSAVNYKDNWACISTEASKLYKKLKEKKPAANDLTYEFDCQKFYDAMNDFSAIAN